MLRDIYTQIGWTDTLIVGMVIVVTALTWFQALAGVVVSRMHSGLKALTIVSLSLVPPLSIPILIGLLFGMDRERGKMATNRRVRRMAIELKPVHQPRPSKDSSGPLTPAPVYSDV